MHALHRPACALQRLQHRRLQRRWTTDPRLGLVVSVADLEQQLRVEPCVVSCDADVEGARGRRRCVEAGESLRPAEARCIASLPVEVEEGV